MKKNINNQDLTFVSSMHTIFLCILFGGNTVAIKICMPVLGVFTTAALRFLLASLAILIWAKITKKSFAVKKEQVYQLAVISIIFVVQISLFHLGLNNSNATRATLISNLQPFFVLFLAHFFIPGDSITKKKFLGISLGFVGISFVFLGKKGINSDLQIGDLIIFISTLMWASSTIYIKRIIHNFTAFHLAFYPMLFAIPIFFLEGFLWDSILIHNIDSKIFISLLYQGLITASFGYVSWNNLLQKYGAVSLHSYVFIMPVTGIFFAGLLLHEPITFRIIAALILIISGIIILNYRPKTVDSIVLNDEDVLIGKDKEEEMI